MVDRIVLDHVAHAVETHEAVLPRYAGDLGARFFGFGEGVGFAPLQVRFANDAKLEILRPHRTDVNPFLRRFLDRRGSGLHHVTFKVPDIVSTMAELEAAGYALVDVNLEWEGWKEAFIHPKAAQGFLVQIAQAAAEMPAVEPEGYPEPVQRADLCRLVLAVADQDAAVRLYGGLLGGSVVDEGSDGAGRWSDLDCGSGMQVRAWQPADPVVLDGASGRADHLVVAVDDPAGVAGAVETTDGAWDVPAAANHGPRLRLVRLAGAP